MPYENIISFTGNLAEDPVVRTTSAGVPVAKLRVAVNRRVFVKSTQSWEDRNDGFFTVNAWRELARHAELSLRKGDRVVVLGRLVSRSWTPKDSTEPRWSTEVECEELAASLRWRTWARGERAYRDPRPDEPPDHAPRADEPGSDEPAGEEAPERVLATSGANAPF